MSVQKYQITQSYSKPRILYQIYQKKEEIKNLNWKIKNLLHYLAKTNWKTSMGVKNFIKNCQQQESFIAKRMHHLG